MNDTTGRVDAVHEREEPTKEAILIAEIWQHILRVDEVDPDDDFYALGGDSLLAIKIVGAAKDRGLPLTLLQLFRAPTPRGAAAQLADAAPHPSTVDTLDLLAPEDRRLVPPDAESAYPATRLQLGMIYESLASEGALYIDTVSRVVHLPLDEATLASALDYLTARHPVLRTRFDLATFGEPVQVVQRSARLPLVVADRAEHHEAVMAELARPFDPEVAPLMRIHAAATGPESFRLSYAFHHAIIDGWSESIFLRELVTTYASLLRGERTELPAPVPFSEYVRLEHASLSNVDSRRFFESLPRNGPAEKRTSPRVTLRKISDSVPSSDADALARRCAEWGVPMKSLLLAACHATVGTLWTVADPVVGVAVNGRPELPGADLTLGLFLNHLPVRFERSGATWRTAAERALRAELELLPHRRFPYAEIRNLLGGEPFEVSLNYMRFHARDELLDAGLIGAEEDMRDFTDLPARVEIFDDPRGLGLMLQVTVDIERYGADLPERLIQHMRAAIRAIAEDPDKEASIP